MKTESHYFPDMNDAGVEIILLDYWTECRYHRRGFEGFEREVYETCMQITLAETNLPLPTRLKMSRNTGVRMPA